MQTVVILFFSHTVISKEAISTQISSSGGNFRDRHSIADGMGQKAEIGVDIKKAQWYNYGYTLGSGDGYASAGETLDVINARDIKAYASAINSHGEESGASISISDRQGMASLEGYSNYAEAKLEASDVHSSVARQQFAVASGNNIRIDEKSSQADGSTASTSMSVFDGYVGSYYGEATASKGMQEIVSELDESFFSRKNWDGAEVGHKANIQGERINLVESAYQDDGDRAFTMALIKDGNIAGYDGRALVGISYYTYGNYGFSYEEMSNYMQKHLTRYRAYEEGSWRSWRGPLRTEGIRAITSLAIAEGAAKMYDGSSSATINDLIVDYRNGFVAESHDDDAESFHLGTINDNDGGKALIKNWGRSAEGDFSFIAIDSP